MNNFRMKYTAQELAIIVPTKDRPEKIERLLDSLGSQSVLCGRIIIMNGGKSVKHVVEGFSERLPVEYHECRPPGQIRQRNMGISLLDQRTPLVGFLDDDIVLNPDALENMIDFWNSVEKDTAGVGFNMTNTDSMYFDSLISLVRLFSSPYPGRVLRSGAAVSINGISENIQTQWLGGGYTVWRQQILRENPQAVLNTVWAHGEDLRFSYPIGKKYPLFVCADAKVVHDHVWDKEPNRNVYRFKARKLALARLYFTTLHSELSTPMCLATLFLRGCLNLSPLGWRRPGYALGQFEAILLFVKSRILSKDLHRLLSDY